MKKSYPSLKTDDAAEHFVETANLADYDLSDMIPVRFELKRKDKTVSLRLPEQLLEAVRARAEHAGMPSQRYMRLAIERAVNEPQHR